MTPAALLSSLESRGVVARVDGEDLRLYPASGIDARVLAEVKAAKPEIVALLREYSQAKADALAALSREVEAARVGPHHVAATARVLAAWRAAEAATGAPLTLRGEPREPIAYEEES